MHRASRKFLLLVAATAALAAVPVASAQAKVLRITGENTTLTPSSTFASFLSAQPVTVSAVGPATINGGALTLPIVGGVVKTPKLDRVLMMAGGVRLTENGHSITLHDFMATRHGARDTVSAKVRGKRLNVARVTAMHLTISGKTATITGELKLTAHAAHALNKFAGHKVVAAGADLGSFASIVTVA